MKTKKLNSMSEKIWSSVKCEIQIDFSNHKSKDSSLDSQHRICHTVEHAAKCQEKVTNEYIF